MKIHWTEKLIPEPNTGCWLYDGCWRQMGRGHWGIVGGPGGRSSRRGTITVGRASYEYFIGKVPDGLHVLHICDCGVCGNPAHLKVGTHQENMADLSRSGRGRGWAGGTSNEEFQKMLEMFRAGCNYSEIGRAFRKTGQAISKLFVRRNAPRG